MANPAKGITDTRLFMKNPMIICISCQLHAQQSGAYRLRLSRIGTCVAIPVPQKDAPSVLHIQPENGPRQQQKFTLSYVGRNSFASLSPFIKAIYTSVDAIPDDAIMIEITCANDRLFFTWLQDFSDDIFVNAFIRKLNSHSISVDDLTSGDIRTPKILLPD